GAGCALLLQVAHPTVAAGVEEHSNFQRDPWGRLVRTLDFTYTMVYGGPAAAARMGARLRAAHERIRGHRADGSPYHALEVEAYAWVHATLAAAIVASHARFGRPLDEDERVRFWREWLAMGRLLGIRPGELPAEWPAFRAYFERMVRERLQHTHAVDEVVRSLERPPPPPVPALERFPLLWAPGRVGGGHLLRLTTVGLLPAALRRRFGLRWTRADAWELTAVGSALRATTPLLPGSLRNTGPGYMRWRERAGVRLR
ncbi:MAG: DUF2236 domain-containing protein, partial [Solirubrobacterales bacterium]|nr:DUF2236 domain-containing protein [Solirubrobacterales bacterium]